MHSNIIFAIVIVLIGTICWLIHLRGAASAKRGHRALPGPIGLPIIGHLHLLGNLPHRSLYKLSQKYGPIMSLRLGTSPTIVVSSPAAAELILKTHDNVFANRPEFQAGKYLSYGSKAMAFTKYNTYWRSVRKITSTELLSPAMINSMAWQRREELGLLVESLKKAVAAGDVVDLSQKVKHLIQDMTWRMVFGKSTDKRFDLSHIIHEAAKLVGSFNIADCIPFLGSLDLQGITRRLKVVGQELDKILEIYLDDHEGDATNGNKELDRDLLAVLLSLQKNPTSTHEIGPSHIKAIMLDIIFGAIDTSQTTIEWSMSELLLHPRVMRLVQEEIKNVVGEREYLEESELSKLEYLDMVVKETLRLHPAGPLMIPHESMEDIVIDGYYIPKKTRIIVNNWGLGRDPKVWSENVDEFYPERFIGSNIDFRGKDFQFLPFGSGRRGCPGLQLGLLNVKLVVAQLVHGFNWELPFGMNADELDMDEIFGVSLLRSTHLLAKPTSRVP
ncbi:Ferulate-5-hydroxylase [Heracleum sosnowskyi]|uniref:Ferulate-5-hydroxylase n=1 Tax=Heracleum sosnowskyi TaxID=360622 RepID=A0AAD8MG42_9APIA|nr:Ferulate-5-hydroxylase [Heracleum sosnowskyi]